MSDDIVAYSLAKHPAPHREKVGLGALLYSLFAAPIVWAGNLMVSYGLIGIWVAFRNWRLTAPPTGHHHTLIERGEGRVHYLAIVGMGFGLMFFLITAVETLSFALVPLCSY